MLDFIRTHYQQEISMQDAARALNYSEPYFCRMFKQQFGRSFTAYLSAYRVERAQELLAQPTVSIKDVGRRVGYPDANYFAKVFRRHDRPEPVGISSRPAVRRPAGPRRPRPSARRAQNGHFALCTNNTPNIW